MKMILSVLFACAVCAYGDNAVGTDITHVLESLSEGTNMHSALKIIKQLKDETDLMKQGMQMSPLAKNVITDLGKVNPEAKIVLDLMNDHFPTIHDLFNLLHHNDLYGDIRNVLSTNKDVKDLLKILKDLDFEYSMDDIVEMIYDLTGYKLDLSSVLITNPRTGKLEVTGPDGDPLKNLVEVMLFAHDNYKWFMNVLYTKTDDPYSLLMQNAANADLTHLLKVKGIQTTDDKYSVSGAGVGTVNFDAEIHKVMQLAKSAKTGSINIKTDESIISLLMKLFSIYDTLVQQAVAAHAVKSS